MPYDIIAYARVRYRARKQAVDWDIIAFFLSRAVSRRYRECMLIVCENNAGAISESALRRTCVWDPCGRMSHPGTHTQVRAGADSLIALRRDIK